MKVGDILKKEVKDTPGLQYPYKIIINEKCKYPKEQIIENEIYIENCNLFLNELYNKRSINKHNSYSQKRNINSYSFKIFETKKNNSIKKLLLRKNTVNLNNNTSMQKDILPLIGNSTPKKVLKFNSNSNSNSNSNNNSQKKITHSLFNNEKSFLKNKIKKLKTLNNDKDPFTNTSSSLFTKKAGMTPTYKSRKMKKNTLFENLFNYRHKNKSIKKNSKKHTLLSSRLQYKINNINHIIDKLNRPIFINIKTEMN
jgi:hypothetical protein